jgi:uncharacterized membrane protein YbhN (UPF0104 family)
MSIVIGAGYFVYQQLLTDNSFEMVAILSLIKSQLQKTIWFFPLLLGLTLLNWLLEIYKWQLLVSTIEKISFKMALRQSLSAHTLSLITPFKAGEYGGKVLYFEKNNRAKIAFLNFIGNMTQLLMTFVLGFLGLVFFINHFSITIYPRKIRFLGFFIAFTIIALIGKKTIPYGKRGNYLQRAMRFAKNISTKTKAKVLLVSLLRYIIFSHQFYLLVVLFGVEVSYQIAIMLIFSMYLLVTLLPVMSLFDFVIKGSVAIYLFQFVGADKGIIMIISTLMWLLNFVLPALIGSYYVLSFQSKKMVLAR